MSGAWPPHLEQAPASASNARMIVIDPRYTDTAAGRKMSGSLIRPGSTDAALVAGIAWVLINEDLVESSFP